MSLQNLNQIKVLLDAAFENHKLGHFSDALTGYYKILELDPRHFETLQLIGFLAYENGKYSDSVDFLTLALQVQPKDAKVFNSRGLAQQKNGNLNLALHDFSQAIHLDNSYYEAFNNRGNLYLSSMHYLDALSDFDSAISVYPDYSDAWCNKGVVLQKMTKFDDAKNCYQKAIKLNPKFAIAHSNLGTLYRDLEQYDLACDHLKIALNLDARYVDAYYNMGMVFHLGKMMPHQAIQYYKKALEINCRLSIARWNMSHCHLMLGNYGYGWRDYESRWQLEGLPANFLRTFEAPLWLGDVSLAGKTILLHAEQGLGDTLQFCRYVKLVAGLGAKVLLEVQPALINVLKDLEGVDTIFSIGDPLPVIDCHCPLMSLPLAFKTTLETIPNQTPYIQASANKVTYWSNRLGSKRRPRVGLVWSGGFRPDQPEVWATNARRNIGLDQIAKLKMEEVDFYSLQKGDPAEQELRNRQNEVWPEDNFYNYTNELVDFSDTAGLIANLDLVISVDTSTAHLAGALGKPVWILNRFDSCWRWLLDRDDSPWYPTAKLYRQTNIGDWDSLLDSVRIDLRKMIM
jgi:tetratricopeptide (TPR) repeat protein